MKRAITLISFLLLLGVFAAAQAPSIPTCDGYNANNVPVVAATGSTLCTDYFGSPNWANSPLPAGTITGYTVLSGGSGYVNPVVMITDTTGSGATATATLDPAGTGTIISVNATNTAGNYSMPQVMVMDTACGTTCGSGAMVTAILGPPFIGGIKKFLDPLPDVKSIIAVPDTLTFPGSDFYVISLTEYQAQNAHQSAAHEAARLRPSESRDRSEHQPEHRCTAKAILLRADHRRTAGSSGSRVVHQ